MAEQHFITDLAQHRALLQTLNLSGRQVFEVGAGHGELTNLIIGAGARCTAVEVDHHLVVEISPRAKVIIGDAAYMDLSFLNESWACICNPPYSLLPWLLDTLDDYGIEDALLMSSMRKAPLLQKKGFEVAFELPGSAFTPQANGSHLVMKRGNFRQFP